jgi:hypothetical protein
MHASGVCVRGGLNPIGPRMHLDLDLDWVG